MNKKSLRAMTWEDYGISKYRYRELKAFCLQYPEKREKLRYGIAGTGKSAVPEKNRTGKPTEAKVLHNDRYLSDCSSIEKAAAEADPILAPWILKSVTQNLNYEKVEYIDGQGRIPVSRSDFYASRRKFYAILDRKRNGET